MNTTAAHKPLGKPIIDVRGATKRFGRDILALDSVDMTVRAGEVVVVIGPSGSGKSTLLRCLNGLEEIDEGSVTIDGHTLLPEESSSVSHAQLRAQRDAIRREVGMVFQQFNLFPHLSVLDNVTLAQKLVRGKSAAEAHTEGMRLLTRVGIADKADVYPAQLSGGQQQRVAIARALALSPRIMLFDEATSALDPEMIGEVLAVMRDLADEGMTMVVVTHEMHFAREAADRVIFMEAGAVVETGEARAFFDAPQTDRARDFLGQLFMEV